MAADQSKQERPITVDTSCSGTSCKNSITTFTDNYCRRRKTVYKHVTCTPICKPSPRWLHKPVLSTRNKSNVVHNTGMSQSHAKKDMIPVREVCSNNNDSTDTHWVKVAAEDSDAFWDRPTQDSVEIVCDFCGKVAEKQCEDCFYNYCCPCLARLHPSVGPFQHHTIRELSSGGAQVQIDPRGQNEELDVTSRYCFTCDSLSCADHRLQKIHEEINSKKLDLMLTMDQTSAAVYRLDAIKQGIDRERDSLMLKGLLKADQIKHEFVSLFYLLVQKQSDLLSALQQEVEKKQEHIKNIWTQCDILEHEEGQLVSDVTDSIQEMRISKFTKKEDELQQRCKDLMQRVNRLHYPVDNADQYPLLSKPFSMYLDKVKINRALSTVDKEFEMEFLQKTLFLTSQERMQPIRVAQYVQLPSATSTSCKVLYEVELKWRTKTTVWKTKTYRLKTLLLKPSLFRPNQCYILRIRQCDITTMSCTRKERNWRRSRHMMICTE